MGKLWVKSLVTRKTTRLRLEEDHIDLPSARWDIPITGSYCWGGLEAAATANHRMDGRA